MSGDPIRSALSMPAAKVAELVGTAVEGIRVLAGTGLIEPVRPDRLVGMAAALVRWGLSPATAYGVATARHPDRVAVVDDAGEHTFRDIDERSNAVARGLADLGVRSGDAVALLIRNSAYFAVAVAACAKVGADLIYLNTGFSGPQIAEVLDGEDAAAVIADDEFADAVKEAAGDRPVVLAWCEGRPPSGVTTMDELADGDRSAPGYNWRQGRHVILTSGTTGKPKGASRPASPGISPVVALLGAIPLRARERTVLAAPMFHAWGMAHFALGMLLGSTLIVSRKFDPERVLRKIEEHDASALVVVPVMLQRMIDIPAQTRRSHDLSSLRIVAVSGSALSVKLAQEFTDDYGDVLYNLYGSTEVAYISVATPTDLREAPGSVGKPLRGVTLRIVDDDDNDVPTGEVGRIFAGSSMTFEGYTGGEDKTRLGDLASIGDVGRLDADGRLWVEGRDDDMIVSGGENVFPAEVEECLRSHADVADVAVVGVDDEKYGARLVAHVVSKGSKQDADALKRHVKSQLANYKVPRDIVFHDELPRNETGKILKRVLTEDGGADAGSDDGGSGSSQRKSGSRSSGGRTKSGAARKSTAGKKTAAKRTAAAKKTATKRMSAKRTQPAASKRATKKTAASKSTASKKTAATKSATKSTAARKSATKKTTARNTGARKSAAGASTSSRSAS